MEFEAHELMYIFDAICYYAIRPEFIDMPVVEQVTDSIAAKAEKKLAAMGYTFEGHIPYPGK